MTKIMKHILIITILIAFISFSFLHRTASLIEFIPLRNKVWIGAFFIR